MKWRPIGVLLTTFTLLTLRPVAKIAAADQDGTPQAAADITELRDRVSKILDREGVAGAAIGIAARDRVIWVDGIGLADVQQQRPVDADTPFRLGSISKNVTALAIMQQVERGNLSLDMRLRDAAPEVPYANAWESTRPVKLADLLEHTAGFDLYRFNDDADYGATARPLIAALEVNPNARQSRWPPGTRVAYSNEGYTVAGYLLEKATGRSFDDVIRDEIFGPLGMRSAHFRYSPVLDGRLAQGYTAEGRAEPYLEDMQRPAANLIASANDMVAYLRMWLGRGEIDGHRVVSADTISRMEKRGSLPYDGPDAQYGLGTDSAQYQGFVAHGHSGITYGFSASFRYFSAEGVGWVVMLNALPADGALSAIESELLAFVMDGTPPKVPIQAPNTNLSELTGYYKNAAPTEEIGALVDDVFGGTDIELRDDGLWERARQAGGVRALISQPPWHRLVPTGGGGFRLDEETISSRLFTRTAEGQPILLTALGYAEQSNAVLAAVKRFLVLGTLVVVTSALLLVPLAFIQAFVPLPIVHNPGALAHLPDLWLLLPPVALALIAPSAWVVLNRATQPLATLNPTTASLLVLSTAFPLLAALTVGVTIATLFNGQVGAFTKAYLTMVAAAGACLSVFEWAAHWLALRTWAW